MEALETLEAKVEKLFRYCTDLKEENQQLKRALDKQERDYKILSSRLAENIEELTSKQISEGISSETQRRQLRKQLDLVIGEIDKLLSALNE